MWDKLKELMRSYAEISRDARTGGMTSTIKDIDNLDISDEEKVARKQDFALKHIGANLAGMSLGTSVAQLDLIPGIATEAAAAGGGYAGYKLGEKADEKYGTKWIAPTLGLVGGVGSGIGAYKGLKPSYNYLAKNGVIGYKDVPEGMITLPKGNTRQAGAETYGRTIVANQPSIVRGGKTSYKFYEQPSKLSHAEKLGIPKGERNQPVKPEYKDLKFIRNLDGLPDMEDGLILAAPKKQLFANFTTDLPFRLHNDYNFAPGSEYMLVSPEAFKGIKPFTIDPMDTIFMNGDLRIDPKHVTILSGNPSVIQQAKQLGMSIKTSPKLQQLYSSVMDDVTTNGLKGFVHSRLAHNYQQAIDEFLTELGRPKYQAYHDLQKKTGLSAGVTWNPKQLVNQIQSAKLKLKTVPISQINQPAFTWPNNQPHSFRALRELKIPDFYKHVGYEPTPSTEIDFLNSMGGFSIAHPETKDAPELLYDLLHNYQHSVGELKQGGKLKKYSLGGHIEEEKNTVPTREEYITQRLEEARLKALEKSRTRTLPKSPIILNEESEEEHNAKRKLFTENIGRLQNTLKELESDKALGFFVDKQIEHTKKKIKTYQDWLSIPYEKYKKGASCIYTTTDNYGKEYLVSGNKTFASNPQKYGFKKIEKTDIQPGDLVQDVSLGYPNHAMIYNGKNESGLDTFNYSRGGDSEGDIVKGGTYKQNAPLDVFRFVGTAKDSAQYINDYNRIYGK